MSTTLWYARVIHVDGDRRTFKIWIFRFYGDFCLPQTYGFFFMILYEMFEDFGNYLRFDLPMKKDAQEQDMPPELMNDRNPPTHPSRCIEDVQLIRWCGENEPVDLTANPTPEQINVTTNHLQAEYLVTVTDSKYLPLKVTPDPLAGCFHFSSTAYDHGKSEIEISVDRHVESILHPRETFIRKVRRDCDILGDDAAYIPLGRLHAMWTFWSQLSDETPMEEIRRYFASVVWASLPNERVVMDLNLLDRVAMKSHSIQTLAQICHDQWANRLRDLSDMPKTTTNEERSRQTRELYDCAKAVSKMDFEILDATNHDNPFGRVKEALEQLDVQDSTKDDVILKTLQDALQC